MLHSHGGCGCGQGRGKGSLQVPRLSVSTLGTGVGWGGRGTARQAPAQRTPLPAPTAKNWRGLGGLWEDYSLILSRSHPGCRRPCRAGRREGAWAPTPCLSPASPCLCPASALPQPCLSPASALPLPCLSPAALQEALREAEWLSSAHHAPLPWLQPFSSHDLGGGRAPFWGRGTWAACLLPHKHGGSCLHAASPGPGGGREGLGALGKAGPEHSGGGSSPWCRCASGWVGGHKPGMLRREDSPSRLPSCPCLCSSVGLTQASLPACPDPPPAPG